MTPSTTNAVIVDAVRTPGGRRNGKLKDWHAADLAAHVLKALEQRNHLDPIPMRRRHRQRASPDRSRGSEDGDALRCFHCSCTAM